MKITPILLCAASFFIISTDAWACEEFVELSVEQLKEMRTTLSNSEADDFEQILAFETMKCDERESIRNFTYETVLKSGNKALIHPVLRRRVLDKDIITLELEPIEGLEGKTLNKIKETPTYSFPVHQKNEDEGVSYLSGTIRNKGVISITGSVIDISIPVSDGPFINGRLTYDDNGNFSGNVNFRGLPGNIPAQIKLSG